MRPADNRLSGRRSGKGEEIEARRTLAGVLRVCFVIALAAVLVGCGGGENESASNGGTAAEETTPAEPTEDPSEEAAAEEEEADAEGDLAAFCDAVDTFADAESKLTSELMDAAGDLAAQQKAYQKFLAKNEQYLEATVEAAPAEIKASAEAYLESYRYYASGGNSPAKQEKFQEDSLKVIGYYRGEC